MLGMVLLYVGAVLIVNGIWLIGQARVASPTAAGEAVADAETHPTFIQSREVAVLNIFTGFIGVVAAVTLAVHGDANEDNAQIRGAAYTLLFAFTYLWVAYNAYVGAGGHGFGWYCLFVAVTAIYAGAYSFSNADGNDASIYLGVSWLAWAVLWFLFFVLLTLERPIAKITGAVAIIEGIGTGWVFGLLLLEGELAF